MKIKIAIMKKRLSVATAFFVILASCFGQSAKKPNILFIMGDDVGWFNISAYHQGIMSGRTPNLDRLAREGMQMISSLANSGISFLRNNTSESWPRPR